MTCAQIRGQLAAYHEGGLHPAQRRAVADHVVSCPACQSELDAYDEGDRALRRLVGETPSEVIYASVLQQLNAQSAASSRRVARLRRSLGKMLNVAGTMGAVGVVGAVVVVLAQGLHTQAVVGALAHKDAGMGGSGPQAVPLSWHPHTAALGRSPAGASFAHDDAVARAAARTGLLLYLRTSDRTENQQGNSEVPILKAPLLGANDQVTTLLPTPGIYSSPAVSPDGRTLAYGVHSLAAPYKSKVRGIWVRPIDCKVAGRHLVVPGDGPSMQFKGIHWASDNRHLIFSVQTRSAVTLYVADTRAMTIVRSFAGWWPAWNQALSPDMRYLALAGGWGVGRAYARTITVRELATGRAWAVGTGAHPIWSPGGRQLAYLAGTTAARLVLMVADALTGQHWPVTAVPQHIEGLSWSPDGHALAYTVRGAGAAANAATQLFVVGTAPGGRPVAGLRARWIGDFAWSAVPQPALR